MRTKTKPFAFRAFVAFMVTWSFLAAVITGVVLYVVPEGRVANWVDWRLLGLTKEGWADVHLAFSVLFLVFGVLHLYPYNWRQWTRYLAERIGERLNPRRPRVELVASLALSAAVVVVAVAGLPPASWLFEGSDAAKKAWVISAEYEAPFGHAEETSLATFAKRQNIDPAAAAAALRAAGLAFGDERESLGRIGAANGRSAMDVYRLLKPLEPKPEPAARTYTEESVETIFEGRGVGKKTVAEMCAEAGVDHARAQARLAARGLRATTGQTLKEIADAAGLRPTDVLKIMLVEPAP